MASSPENPRRFTRYPDELCRALGEAILRRSATFCTGSCLVTGPRTVPRTRDRYLCHPSTRSPRPPLSNRLLAVSGREFRQVMLRLETKPVTILSKTGDSQERSHSCRNDLFLPTLWLASPPE